MIVTGSVPALEAYWQDLERHLPRFLPEEQRVAVALYHELAKGLAVDAAQLGRALGISLEECQALLRRASINDFIYPDDQGRVLGFGGLAAAPMHHQFEVDNCTLSTWCAWDSLFIPEILGRPARITSPDPETGELVRLVVTADGIESAEPPDAVVSFVRPDSEVFGTSAANVMAKFCHFIFFFSSRLSGESWVAKHPGTFLYSLDEAFVLAKRLNARNFGPELARRASSTAACDNPTSP
jgi:alkylmercury lyase